MLLIITTRFFLLLLDIKPALLNKRSWKRNNQTSIHFNSKPSLFFTKQILRFCTYNLSVFIYHIMLLVVLSLLADHFIISFLLQAITITGCGAATNN